MKMTSESKQATNPPVAKKQVVNKNQSAVDYGKELVNHSESSRSKGIMELPVKLAINVINSIKPYAKLSVDGDIVTEKTTTTLTTTNHHASTNKNSCETMLTKNKPTAT